MKEMSASVVLVLQRDTADLHCLFTHCMLCVAAVPVGLHVLSKLASSVQLQLAPITQNKQLSPAATCTNNSNSSVQVQLVDHLIICKMAASGLQEIVTERANSPKYCLKAEQKQAIICLLTRKTYFSLCLLATRSRPRRTTKTLRKSSTATMRRLRNN